MEPGAGASAGAACAPDPVGRARARCGAARRGTPQLVASAHHAQRQGRAGGGKGAPRVERPPSARGGGFYFCRAAPGRAARRPLARDAALAACFVRAVGQGLFPARPPARPRGARPSRARAPPAREARATSPYVCVCARRRPVCAPRRTLPRGVRAAPRWRGRAQGERGRRWVGASGRRGWGRRSGGRTDRTPLPALHAARGIRGFGGRGGACDPAGARSRRGRRRRAGS